MEKGKGYEYTSINPGWIKKKVPNSYADDVLKEIILFYVINTPCTELSSSGIAMTEYGWSKNVWKNENLKNELFRIAELERGKSFIVAKKICEMKKACEQIHMKKGFQNDRSTQKIVIYKSKPNEFLSIFHHIRNSFAHGRLAMYSCVDDDIMFVLEDGIKKNSQFQVRSRMILKKSTLKTWMDIIKSGKIPNETK